MLYEVITRGEGEPVRILDRYDRGDAAVRRDAVDGGAGPKAILPVGAGNLAVLERAAHRRVGEPDAAVRMTDHVVRTVEAATLEPLGQLDDLAVMLGPGDAAVLALAMDQPALQVEGEAVAAA